MGPVVVVSCKPPPVQCVKIPFATMRPFLLLFLLCVLGTNSQTPPAILKTQNVTFPSFGRRMGVFIGQEKAVWVRSGFFEIYSFVSKFWETYPHQLNQHNLLAATTKNVLFVASGGTPSPFATSPTITKINLGAPGNQPPLIIWPLHYNQLFTNMVINGDFLIFLAVSSDVYFYNISSSAFHPTQYSLHIPRTDVATVTIGSLTLFAGGHLPQSVGSDAVELYDRQTHSIILLSSKLPTPRALISTAVHGKYVIFAGGAVYSSSGGTCPCLYQCVTDIDIWDATTRLFVRNLKFSTAKRNIGMAILDSYVVMFGSVYGPNSYVLRTVDAIDMNSLTLFENRTHVIWRDADQTSVVSTSNQALAYLDASQRVGEVFRKFTCELTGHRCVRCFWQHKCCIQFYFYYKYDI